MPSTTTQRKLASQFISVTNATKENAQQYLKNANYNLDAAVNLNMAASLESQEPHVMFARLFTSCFHRRSRAPPPAQKSFLPPEGSGNTMGAESLEGYFKQLGLNLENYELFVLLDIVQADGLGQITLKGFVDGWLQASQDPNHRVQADIASQKKYARHCAAQAAKDPVYFKKLYHRAFLTGKEPQQKALDKEVAIVFWEMLFSPAVHPWRSKNVNWLDVWKQFLEAKWTRSVNKDMWSQTLSFADKTMEDETLGFWSEDQAWPGVIDDFVAWCRETGVVAPPKAANDGMEVDE
ncbi:Cullin binding-domain-containing protein [Podospora aff. communis PSN243]|uniref:Defective in cullin neddylation protein n=1 Tax=Podospora aff. communis PSN243 TaxID=3040156 RepID=A0AAV9G769_9PEZI|nr:Cullin binding-domain-containing protein [Podospora aff. communis PSN243]